MKRVNIGLEEELHAKAKIIAILKKTSLSKYLENCIKEAMKEDKKIFEELAKK
jgi:predicted HicB family RNase H-like nuclease